MNKIILMVVIFSLIVGCSPKKGGQDLAIKVNDYEMSIEEFNEDYMDVKAVRGQTLDSKDQFIQEIITKKALLQEAQRQGIDKEEDFLKTAERFWEQSLLTILLDRETKGLSAGIKVSNKEIEDYYNSLDEEEKQSKTLDELKPQITLMLMRIKAAQALNDRIDSIVKNSNVFVNPSIKNNK